MLSKERIQELSTRKGVKTIAVKNFLFSIAANDNCAFALLNLEMDKNLYKWNAATVNAIRQGIVEYFEE